MGTSSLGNMEKIPESTNIFWREKSQSDSVLSKRGKDYMIDVQSQEKRKRYLRNARDNTRPIIALLVLCMLVLS